MSTFNYDITKIADIIAPIDLKIAEAAAPVRHLLTDSRSLTYPEDSLFFAIVTQSGNGHRYVDDLYRRGVRSFVVSQMPDTRLYPDANFLLVGDTNIALQRLASEHRAQFTSPLLAITGSRGKTTVKEWLYQMLKDDEEIVRSPRSYNSHIGVPLSLWELGDDTTLGIFEAGVSRKGEMQALEAMLRPDTVLVTNVTHEHDEGFGTLDDKALEKVSLARNAKTLVYNLDDTHVAAAVANAHLGCRFFTWSAKDPSATLFVTAAVNLGDSTEVEMLYNNEGDAKTMVCVLPFTDAGQVQDAIATVACLLSLGADADTVARRVSTLQPIDTRLRVIDGVNDCLLLLDGYTSDLRSLGPAIDFMARRATAERSLTVILSDIRHENLKTSDVYRNTAKLLERKNVTRLVGVGHEISANAKYFNIESRFFDTTDEFVAEMSTSDFDHELILVKGAPEFHFNRIIERLESRQHETVLEVNLDAMADNYNFFKQFLKPGTGIVAMVKASAYGAGSYEPAKTLQSMGAAYLAVAAHDEGVALRQAGITMPIMVLNPKVVNYPALFANSLEPAIYNFETLYEIIHEGEKCGVTDYPVHIKIDSGMHRVGFLKEQLAELTSVLAAQSVVLPRSIFSHLCAADDPADDDYTRAQFACFDACADMLQSAYPDHHILRHILNSTGIVRFAEHQYDMVRLGIGLYGIRTLDDGSMDGLRPISALYSVVISVKEWPAGTTIGYNRRGVLKRRSRIATIPIGYADGLDRHFGNGHTCFYINGHRCPTIGNICMDLCMVDVTDCGECRVGDRVEIFGPHVSAEEQARVLDTIPYEILTSVASRVKRIYYRE